MAKLVLLLVFACFQFSLSENVPEIEQVKLDVTEDEIPFNNQTGPDTEVLDGADEDQWYQGPRLEDEDEIPFNNQTGPDTEVLDGSDEDQQGKGSKFDSIKVTEAEELAKLIEELKEWAAEDSDYSISDEWTAFDKINDYLYSVWEIGGPDIYAELSSEDEVFNKNSNGNGHPVKRFTSV